MNEAADNTSKKPVMTRMVAWYDPRQLVRTAIDVAISSLFGSRADYRLVEAINPSEANESLWDDDPIDPAEEHDEFFDYSRRDSLWLDYIADSGSGWNPTYAVAYYATRPKLEFTSEKPDGSLRTDTTSRGEILVFGGDQVYPVASRKGYRDRLIGPFKAAFDNTPAPHPRVFAIPGNHDWYDNLVSFTRLFSARRWFAGWKTRQRRSYFALKLPHGWWLIGTDIQLEADIDIPQLKYFKRVAKQMAPNDRVILCTAEPHWIFAKVYRQFDPEISEKNLAVLEKEIFEKRITVYLAGDLHHYRRHENDDRIQKITAGGGGAHWHATHAWDVLDLEDGFHWRKSFPPIDKSRKLIWRNFAFLFLNPWFGLFTAPLYLLTAWTVKARIGQYGLGQIWPALKATIAATLVSPGAVFWILVIWGGFLMFTDTHSKLYRTIGSSLHGLVHLMCVFLIGWFATYVGVTCLQLEFGRPRQLLVAGGIILVMGWIVSSMVMGLYLLISLNVFKRHLDEASSSLALQDWKNFLRMHIDPTGLLTIFPIGIRRVPRTWSPSPNGSQPLFEPADTRATPPELIEPPISV